MQGLTFIAKTSSALTAAKCWSAATITLVFTAFAWTVRGVSASGAAAGAVVCFALIAGAGWGGFAALCAVFVLTWAATRIGYARKQTLGTAEAQGGRSALQVLANVGVAAICALSYAAFRAPRALVCLSSALAEAAADTVSSEIGQAAGGMPRLVTTWRRVPAGTDGAVSLLGTFAAAAAAVAVSVTCVLGGLFRWRECAISVVAGMAGTIADSLLGATLEQKGIMGNDGVNFSSTALAAAIALVLS